MTGLGNMSCDQRAPSRLKHRQNGLEASRMFKIFDDEESKRNGLCGDGEEPISDSSCEC